MRRTAISRVGAPRCGAGRGPVGADDRRGGGGRVPGGELSGRPAELQYAGVQRFRDARDEDQAGVQSRGSRAARTHHRQRRGAGTGRARRAGAGHDQRPGGHAASRASAGRERSGGATAATRFSSTPTRPTRQPIALKNVRANQRCPRPRRAQAAGYRSRTFNISGATRVVQRVICVGGNGRKSCSARGSNYIRTYKAEVGIADTLAPTVGIIGDSALARGEWVQRDPAAQLRRQRQRRRAHGPSGRLRADRRHATAPVRAGVSRRRLRQRRSVPERARSYRRGNEPLPRGHAGACGAGPGHRRQHRDLGRGDGSDRQQPARPGRGRRRWAARDGGTATASRVTWANPPENDRAPIVAAGYKLCAAGGGRLHSGRAVRPRHRAPRGSGSVARARGPCRCGDATRPGTRPRPRRRCR